jgi:type IX secretion system PorP/SprF family membrane protein
MIRFLSIIPLTFVFGMALAQDPQFSQYMFNNMSINPGYAGSKDAIWLTAYNRMQWLGFPGAPTTTLFTAMMPLKPFNINSGIGLTAMDDVVQFQSTPSVNVSYSYISNVGNADGKLGIGISVGFLSSTFTPTYYWGVNGQSEDLSVVPQSGTATTFDVGLGGYYHTENLYLGVSSTHITQPTYHFNSSSGNSTFPLTRNYYVTTGYNLSMADPAFELQPSAIIRFAGASSSIDLSTLLLWNKKIWGGLSYRWDAAIILILGIELSNGIRIGYSFDYSVNALVAPTHEIMLSYNFSLVKEKFLPKYRSVRFL